MTLSAELRREAERIAEIAREYGLDFFETIFEETSTYGMNELAAYGGFPIRFNHWRFGMDFDRLSKSDAYGLSHIYEMVINNDPCYAYLQNTNRLVDNQMVMAHVYGHCDFFKNNIWFSRTDRHMVDRMAEHASEIGHIIETHGLEKVERFMDAAFSLEGLIDPFSVFRTEKPEVTEEEDESRVDISQLKFRTKEYLDSFVNPRAVLEEELRRIKEELERRQDSPRQPERDVLKFLIQHAPLRTWQQRILNILRKEAYYFAPQGMTKIMNEGWASYWHTRIMTERILKDGDLTAYADHCSRTLAMPPGSFNPYRVGLAIWLDIEERWNKGRFGREWEECEDYAARRAWDTGAGIGLEKMFEVRRFNNDITFIDTFFSREVCHDQRLFTTKMDPHDKTAKIGERDFRAVKTQLLLQLANMGRPVIEVVSSNFDNRGELLLRHTHYGLDLDLQYAEATLRNIVKIWSRPVLIDTLLNGKQVLLCFDGEKFGQRDMAEGTQQSLPSPAPSS